MTAEPGVLDSALRRPEESSAAFTDRGLEALRTRPPGTCRPLREVVEETVAEIREDAANEGVRVEVAEVRPGPPGQEAAAQLGGEITLEMRARGGEHLRVGGAR